MKSMKPCNDVSWDLKILPTKTKKKQIKCQLGSAPHFEDSRVEDPEDLKHVDSTNYVSNRQTCIKQ